MTAATRERPGVAGPGVPEISCGSSIDTDGSTPDWPASLNRSTCAALRHGRRLGPDESLEFLAALAPGGRLHDAIVSGVVSVRYGVNDFVLSWFDGADSRVCEIPLRCR